MRKPWRRTLLQRIRADVNLRRLAAAASGDTSMTRAQVKASMYLVRKCLDALERQPAQGEKW